MRRRPEGRPIPSERDRAIAGHAGFPGGGRFRLADVPERPLSVLGGAFRAVDATEVNETMERAIVESAEKLEGAAELIKLLEDKADRETITAAELSAVRCVVESCAQVLDASWQQA